MIQIPRKSDLKGDVARQLALPVSVTGDNCIPVCRACGELKLHMLFPDGPATLQ
jgi:uncharacterized radical SAM superfamily protein